MSNPIILAVDDNPSILKSINYMLSAQYQVYAVPSGKEAMLYLKDKPVDLVLLDYDMPDMTGYEVLMAIRSRVQLKNTPVVFLTGETNERMKNEMVGRGASDYICKPIDSSALHQCIEKLLSR